MVFCDGLDYRYIHAYSGDSTQLTYLRSRYYSSGTGRFLTRDTWGGDANSPMSFNRWTYVVGNQINSRDPLGQCANCYVYYFPGVGNAGDLDGDGTIEDAVPGTYEIGYGEKRLITDLRQRTGAKVEVIFPFGPGVSGQYDREKVMGSLAYDEKSPVAFYKAQEIIARTLDLPIDLCYADNFGIGAFDNNSLNITFIGYSGGGQAAYATAQMLSGKLFVDNLVAFGAPIRPYNGLANIGRFFSFMSVQDDAMMNGPLFPLAALWGVEDQYKYLSYNSNKTTVCHLFGNDQEPYVHFDHGFNDYFGDSAMDNGRNCLGEFYWRSVSRDQASRDKLTRYQANLEWLIRIIEGTLK